ncbi:MAG: carbohydrate ABC transporter permease [Thermoplasmata archaeon]
MTDGRPPPAVRRPRRFTLPKLGLYAAVTALSAFFLFPIYIIFLVAFVPTKYTLFSGRPPLLPPSFTWANLQAGLNASTSPLLPSMYLSIEIAFLVGLIAIAIGIPTAYGLSRLDARLAYGLTTVLFVVNMVPSITIAIPIVEPFIKIGLYGSALSIGLTQELLALPMTVFLLLGSFQGLPPDLENQARVDGAGRMRAVYGNLVPLVRPALVAAFLLSWMLSWDESTFALILYNPGTTATLPVNIFLAFTGRGNPAVGVAFSVIATIPVIVLTVVLQRYLKGEDLAAGVRG